MAVYDGFFDAVLDEETGEYDRDYGSSDFTDYFANVIGSGVCVHNNPNSFKVRLEDGRAVVGPGYLFIQGYWLKNDADYPIDLPGTGNYAIAAHLNLGKRMIELEARSVAQAYPDSLVLAIVSPTAAEDTRHNTDICGVIDTAGALSSKVEWAVNYIDTEIESKLAQVERDINAQAEKLDRKIAEVQAVADSIVPPPIGSIKFSASQDVGPEWLRCDGSFINEADYPELVAALGKLTPSGDKFQLISSGEIGPQISNGVVYGGRMWVYSYSTRKLYGVDLEGTGAVKEIAVTSTDDHFSMFIPPSPTRPLSLSIIPHKNGDGAKLYIAQFIADNGESGRGPNPGNEWMQTLLIFGAEFSEEKESLDVTPPFNDIPKKAHKIGEKEYYHYIRFLPNLYVPYIVSSVANGTETYFCAVGDVYSTYGGGSYGSARLFWDAGGTVSYDDNLLDRSVAASRRMAYTPKNFGEAIYVGVSTDSSHKRTSYNVVSQPTGRFASEEKTFSGLVYASDTLIRALPIASNSKVLFSFNLDSFPWVSIESSSAQFLKVNPNIRLNSAARIFTDAAAYLWGKDIYMIFVGTGIIFSRTLEEGDFGYLDTTSVLGTITQFGYLDYDESEGTLYLLGQDTTNTVKVAKIVLNTLYDYANDGAWLPMVAADGVPAYIKAKGKDAPVVGDTLTVTVESPKYAYIDGYAVIEFNGQTLGTGTYQYSYPGGSGNFTASVRAINTTTQAITLRVNGSTMATLPKGSTEGVKKSITLGVSSYMVSGLTLVLSTT